MGWIGGLPSPAASDQASNQLQFSKSALPPVSKKKRIMYAPRERGWGQAFLHISIAYYMQKGGGGKESRKHVKLRT